MASITIRDLPDKTKETLRIHAAQSGLSLEAYVRQILKKASTSDQHKPANIADLADQYFGSKHGIELEIPKRKSTREPVKFQS